MLNLSLPALRIIEAIFAESSNIQVPMGPLVYYLEIRQAVASELSRLQEEASAAQAEAHSKS